MGTRTILAAEAPLFAQKLFAWTARIVVRNSVLEASTWPSAVLLKQFYASCFKCVSNRGRIGKCHGGFSVSYFGTVDGCKAHP